MDDIELTEMYDLDVERQDAVKTPASGYGWLVMKASDEDAGKDVNAVGGIDEAPDIAGADHVLTLLYQLVAAEAREGAAGADETCDIHILSEAISLIRWFRENEQEGAMEDDGSFCKATGLVFKAHRKFSSDQRKSLASEGKALPDGSYPIPDADALRRAAILARSGHGDVAAAKRLIAKRAKELGVQNPLSDHDNSASKDAQTETPETDAPEIDERVVKMIEDAKAEVSKAAEDRVKVIADELAVLKATPIPGNIVVTAPAANDDKAKGSRFEKAAYYRRLAGTDGMPRDLAKTYQEKAAEIERSL